MSTPNKGAKSQREKRADAIKLSEDKAREKAAAQPKKLKAKPLDRGTSYGDLATAWRRDGNEREYERMLSEATGPGPEAYAPYKIVWNDAQLRQEDVIKVATDMFGVEKVNAELSLLSPVFPCSGVSGREFGSKGGGCTLFVAKSEAVPNGLKIRYSFDAIGEDDALEMEAEVWPDPLCGLIGTRLGAISGELYQSTFDPKKRNADLQELIYKALKTPNLKFAVKNLKDREGVWTLTAYAHGNAKDKRDAVAKLRKGVDIEWEGWVRTVKITNGGPADKKVRVEQSQKVQERIHQELTDTCDRRIHVYKLRADIVESQEMLDKFKVECEKFGILAQEPGVRTSKDGCAFA